MDLRRAAAAAWLCASSAVSAAAAFVAAADRGVFPRHLGAGRWALVAALAAASLFALGLLLRRLDRGPLSFTKLHARLLLYALVAAIGLQAFAADHTHLPVWGVLAAAVLAVYPAVLALNGRVERVLARRPYRVADLAAMNLCVALIAGEAALRLVARVAPSPLFETVDLDTIWRSRHYGFAPGEEHFGFACNSRGYYDEEFVPRSASDRAGPRVVCVGDSFSSSRVPHAFHFTTVCEERIPGADVMNVGVSTAGPWDYLYWVRNDVRALEPDLIVVDLFLGNDLRDARSRGDAELRPLWLHRSNLLSYLVPKRLLRIGSEPHWPRRARSGRTGPPGRPTVPVDELARVFPWLHRPELEKATFSEARFLSMELDLALEACGGETRGLELLELAIERIRAAAGPTPLALLLIPDEFQVEDRLWAELVARSQGRALDRDRPQRRLTRWLDARGIPYADLLPALRAAPTAADGRRRVYRLQDSHFNALGNRIAGEELAALVHRALPARHAPPTASNH